MQHTQGRVKVLNPHGLDFKTHPHAASIFAENGRFIAKFERLIDGEQAQQAEDIRRLVACWNACDGISTKNLEDNIPIKELAHNYTLVGAALTRQQAEHAAYVAGSEEAFAAVVEQKREAEQRATRFEAALRDHQALTQKWAGERQELAMLVKQLVSHLRRAAPDDALAAKAMDYLKRKELLGSVLREGVEVAVTRRSTT